MEEQQKTFLTQDSTELFYRYRPAQDGSQDKAIVIFHRGHEHSGRVMYLADELGLEQFSYFAWDARGHGKSPGERGDSPSLATSIGDVDTFIRHIQKEYHIEEENIVVIAQSVGAVLVSAWLHDYAPKIRAAILASPAFEVKLYVPFAISGLRLMQKIKGNFYVNSYVKSKYLTHDDVRKKSFDEDKLITRAISVRILLGLYDTGKRIVKDSQAIGTPIQLFISGNDWVVYHQPQHQFYNHLGSKIKERHIIDGFYHDTLGEKNRQPVLSEIKRFIEQRFSQSLELRDFTQAHLYGESRILADELSSPLPNFSLKGVYWRFMKWSMDIGAGLSKGLKLGRETGFDSGSTLDYVYQNEPQGKNVLGQFIDKQYLNSAGWSGIRQRKTNLGKIIQQVFDLLKKEQQPIHIMDIAAGHGRYILDALPSGFKPDSIVLRDYSELNIEAGKQLIIERNLQDIATFIKADAYDRSSYQNIHPAPTLGIVSGLHELFSDNDLIMQSLFGFADAISTEGYLIYTNQPWHPQQELIARSLTSHRKGMQWVMRCRSQAEMDQLVEKAGFKKIAQLNDDQGIFTVSLAKKQD